MTTFAPTREVLDEDLQIVSGTLAAITDDVSSYSHSAAEAIRRALTHLDEARREMSRPELPTGGERFRPRGRQA